MTDQQETPGGEAEQRGADERADRAADFSAERSDSAQPAYPQHWEADVLSSDGGDRAHPPDQGRRTARQIREMHRRTSPRSLYLRYFSAVRELSEQQLSVYIDLDYSSRVGLLAEVGGAPVAAGTYHRLTGWDEAAAEVAFIVEDGQQRRGLGSILLEHLAAAAQENGIRRFTAEVLAENNTMVRVFIDAGYVVKREYESGVVDLEFDIGPTEKSIQVTRSREHRAESRSIARLLTPSSIAVIGASDEPTALGHAVLQNLLRGGFSGPVYPVTPGARSVLGVRAYETVTDIPDPVDLAVLAVPSSEASDVLAACQAKGVRGLVVMAGGLVDLDKAVEATNVAGTDGAARAGAAFAQRQMVMKARAAGMRVVGPNCLGMVNTDPAIRMNATPATVVPPPGRIGFFCQSGALGIAILADAAASGAGAVDVRLRRQPGGRLGQRPAAVLARRRRHRCRAAVPGVVRQPAEVRPAGPRAGPDQAGDRGEVGSSCDDDARARRELGADLRRGRRDALRAVRSDPHGHTHGCVRRRAAAGDAAGAGWGARGGGRELQRAGRSRAGRVP